MADSGLNTDIKKVVKALARFYKVSLSNGKDIITLREGTITIHGMSMDGTIRLLITDDGVGMSANQIDDMLAGISRSKIGGSSYGVKNVMERIRHYFGAPANLAFRSVPGTGTEVEITFPRVEEGD